MPDQETVVIKLGGHAMDDLELLNGFAADLKALARQNLQFVLVHGGGPAINKLLERLQIESSFVNGLRVTSEETLEAVEMALCGSVNKSITRLLQKSGVNAVGISGEDGGLLQAKIKDAALGRVGEIAQVNPQVLVTLLNGSFTPVVAPLALDANGDVLNVNADTAAGAIAGAFKAKYFILISDVPGVLDAGKQVLSELNGQQIAEMKANGVIHGGMIPKVECCQKAIKAGCRQALILDGGQKNSLSRFINNGEKLGTLIKA